MKYTQKIVVLVAMIAGLYVEGVVYAQTSIPSVPSAPEIDKQQIIDYLKLTNQSNALNAQFESSLTSQQKKMLEIMQENSKTIKVQLEKLNNLCGKGFTFSEQAITCTISVPSIPSTLSK